MGGFQKPTGRLLARRCGLRRGGAAVPDRAAVPGAGVDPGPGRPPRRRASRRVRRPAASSTSSSPSWPSPGREDWERVEGEINRIWSRSGSPAMDLLLQRGNEALGAGGLSDGDRAFLRADRHAPDFAEGWNARATTYYLMGEYLAVDRRRRARAGARTRGISARWPASPSCSSRWASRSWRCEALEAVQELNPNRPNINEAVTRLGADDGGRRALRARAAPGELKRMAFDDAPPPASRRSSGRPTPARPTTRSSGCSRTAAG